MGSSGEGAHAALGVPRAREDEDNWGSACSPAGSLGWSSVEILPCVPRKRFQLRPPGLKPTTKVGTLGPYRGRLGLAWVIAPLVAGVVIVVAGVLILTR
jgi:hypothetical protein